MDLFGRSLAQMQNSPGVCPMQSAIANSSYERKSEKHRLPAPEDAMTFQVVLIGSDGLIVASDRRESNIGEAQPGVLPAVQRNTTEKYLKSDDGSVICFAAGGPFVRDVARAIALNCQPVNSMLQWEENLKNVSEQIARERQLSRLYEFIVVRRDSCNVAWIVANEGGFSEVSKVLDRRCTGDNSTARFLPCHLWTRATVRELKLLAVLTLAYAHRENPSGVSEEFDVMTLDTAGKIEWETCGVADTVYGEFDERLKALFLEISSHL
jgi:hypothetical protein